MMGVVVASFCRVCGYPSEHAEEQIGHVLNVSCHRCGDYRISDSCAAILGDPLQENGLLNNDLKKASVGHWLRQRQELGEKPLLIADIVERLAAKPWFPTLHDQREGLLRLIGKRTCGPGETITIDNISD